MATFTAHGADVLSLRGRGGPSCGASTLPVALRSSRPCRKSPLAKTQVLRLGVTGSGGRASAVRCEASNGSTPASSNGSSPDRPLKVLVAGGGIGGLAAGLACKNQGLGE
eukprot:scaffold199731_cov42-Prasinocladus_malaysianus.AAC.1